MRYRTAVALLAAGVVAAAGLLAFELSLPRTSLFNVVAAVVLVAGAALNLLFLRGTVTRRGTVIGKHSTVTGRRAPGARPARLILASWNGNPVLVAPRDHRH